MKKELVNYTNDIVIIKNAILTSQHKVVKSANAEQLSLYYGIGRYISVRTRKKIWGTNAIEIISEQLQKQLPGLRGYSTTIVSSLVRNFDPEKSPKSIMLR